MRRLFVSVLPYLALPMTAVAQTAHSRPHTATAPVLVQLAPKSSELRVTHVSLYKNGVGFFEHEARVTGDETLTLALSSAQLNDVLQTLTAVDLNGGHITGASYQSTTPLEQQLRTLPLSLGQQPTQENLFTALRGARVEVTGAGAVFTGRLLSLEERTPAPGDEQNRPVTERRYVTVVADSGATRTLELTPAVTVRLLDAGLRADLNTYLELLDRNRAEGVRHLSLTDRGVGPRLLRVSFLSEVPVWKSTYRLLMTDTGSSAGQSATLQGFSVVDNTTGEDWKNVQLSLIAGNPQSFLQPIAQPIYSRRPEIAIAQNAQITPQTHESAEESVAQPTVPPNSASASLSSAAGGNPSALVDNPDGSVGGPVEMDGTLRAAARIPKNINMMKDTGPPPPPLFATSKASSPLLYEQAVRESMQTHTMTAAFDDFFAYNLTDPVSIPRNGSALVPILEAQLPTERVTLWSPSEPRPLRAVWLTNDSQLTLDRGSFSVIENGAFAGEGLLDPVHQGEKRLISYAVDQAVRVAQSNREETRRVTSVTVAKGVLRATNTEVHTATYRISDAAPEARTVLLEEPRRIDWTLKPDARLAESTPSAYRFRVEVGAHGAAQLTVTQQHTLDERFSLVSSTESQLTFYLRNNGADPAVVAKLEPVFAAKRAVAALDERIRETQDKVRSIGEDQRRLRDNLTALKGSAEERALVRRYTAELNAQEDTLGSLQRDLAALRQQRSAAQAQVSHQIDVLQVGEPT